MIPTSEKITGYRQTKTLNPATGRVQLDGETPFTLWASIQPANEETVERLSSGWVATDIRSIRTYTKLRAADADTGEEPDQLLFAPSEDEDPVRWTVLEVRHWRKIKPHYRAVVVRQKEAG